MRGIPHPSPSYSFLPSLLVQRGVWDQVRQAKEQMGVGDLEQLYNAGEIWTVD